MPTSVLGTIVEGPNNVTYIPGLTPLPIEMICNCTGEILWIIDNIFYDLADGAPPGHSSTGTNILVNSPVNNTEYICISPTYNPSVNSTHSDPAYIVIAGKIFPRVHTYVSIFCILYIYCTL